MDDDFGKAMIKALRTGGEVDIDIRRPILKNKDGTSSTERTITIEADGRHLLLPTIVSGQEMHPDAAVALWQRGFNSPVGDFGDAEEAERAAVARSERIGRVRGLGNERRGDVLVEALRNYRQDQSQGR